MEIPFYYSINNLEKNLYLDYHNYKTNFTNFFEYLNFIDDKVDAEINRLSNTEYDPTANDILKFNEIEDLDSLVLQNLLTFLREETDFPLVGLKEEDSIKDYLLKIRLGILNPFDDSGKILSTTKENNKLLRLLIKKEVIGKLEEISHYIQNKIIENDINESLKLEVFERSENDYSGKVGQTEIPELDFSNNTDKVKLIMLEKLGVIDYIKTIQTKPETISHTSEILSTITGIPSKTLNTYLYPMIRPHRDDDDKNSPYKNPENCQKAERELIKLKIKNIGC